MVSINIDDETNTILEKYLPDYDNNKSLLIRDCVKRYDNVKQQRKKQVNSVLFMQFLVFLFLGAGLLTFALSSILLIALLIAPFLLIIAGVLLIIFCIVLLKNRVIAVGDAL